MNLSNVTSVKNPVMTLITKAEMTKLIKAGYNNRLPIVKLFMGRVTWLLTGYEDGYFYGYGDIGQGCVEWGGLTNIEELPTLKIGFAYLERDRWFSPDPSITVSDYLDKSSLIGL